MNGRALNSFSVLVEQLKQSGAMKVQEIKAGQESTRTDWEMPG